MANIFHGIYSIQQFKPIYAPIHKLAHLCLAKADSKCNIYQLFWDRKYKGRRGINGAMNKPIPWEFFYHWPIPFSLMFYKEYFMEYSLG